MSRRLSPEEDLWTAVLYQAFTDAVLPPIENVISKTRADAARIQAAAINEAREFIFSGRIFDISDCLGISRIAIKKIVAEILPRETVK